MNDVADLDSDRRRIALLRCDPGEGPELEASRASLLAGKLVLARKKWLTYLTGIKTALGNLNNDLGFVATLLAKHYLERRFGVVDFDAAGKPQGASGVDIEASTPDGLSIVGELKTTKPYQPGFGAAQRTQIIKDLNRLAGYKADHRFMFVVDVEAYSALCRPALASRAPGVEIVDLVSGATFVCPAP